MWYGGEQMQRRLRVEKDKREYSIQEAVTLLSSRQSLH
jgi:hypothetical protein